MKQIEIVIVDDAKDTRETICRLLEFEEDIKVIGEGCTGTEAIQLVEKLHPDMVLMDISMPDMDGIRATELITLRSPQTSVIMISFQNEIEYMKKAMMAGAREYMVKPFSPSELINTIKEVHEIDSQKKEAADSSTLGITFNSKTEADIISFFSTKGGSGKTSLAVNTAVALADLKKWRVLLLDLNLQFGDVASFFNIVPKKTIADLTQAKAEEFDDMRQYFITHSSGVRVLSAPTRPEYAELVSSENIQNILKECQKHYDFIICDNSNSFDDISLVSLDLAKEIWLVMGMDIPSIKNSKLSIEVLESLNYSSKIKMILNRFDKKIGINIKDLQNSINRPIGFSIPNEEYSMVHALNKGIPYIEAYPRGKAASSIRSMARHLTEQDQQENEDPETAKKGFKDILSFSR